MFAFTICKCYLFLTKKIDGFFVNITILFTRKHKLEMQMQRKFSMCFFLFIFPFVNNA